MNESISHKILNENSNLFCPNNNCLHVPEIIYSYNPLNSYIQYKCNSQNNEEIKMSLDEFLEKASNIKCSKCGLNLGNDIYYCKKCKNVIDYNCFEDHIEKHNELTDHEIVPINVNDLINNCLEDDNMFIFHCIECNQNLCSKCDLMFHNNQRHNLVQIINSSCNNNVKEKINTVFQKQKQFLEKIKIINEKMIKALENDIKIKEKIIESNKMNKYNYNIIANYNNLYIMFL